MVANEKHTHTRTFGIRIEEYTNINTYTIR